MLGAMAAAALGSKPGDGRTRAPAESDETPGGAAVVVNHLVREMGGTVQRVSPTYFEDFCKTIQ